MVEGTNVQELTGAALQAFRREKLAMVFQHFALFPHRNVIANTAYGLKVQGIEKRERHEAAIEALAMVGLEAYAFNSTRELSGGMQQRVGLARALCSNPEILLMDAAFSALAPLVRRHHVIARICQGQHDVSPAVGQFRKPVQQQNQGTVGFFGPDLHQVH